MTAEGVENDRQVVSLMAMRCGYGPGLLLFESAGHRGGEGARGDEPFLVRARIQTPSSQPDRVDGSRQTSVIIYVC